MAQIAVIAVMALSALNEGAQKRKMKMAEAEGFSDAANRKMAATTAKMEEEQDLKERMQGRALAVAAASGAGVDDPTMVNLIGDLNAEGTYRVMAALYVGQDEAEGLREQGRNAFREGQYALQEGYMNAVKTVMSSFGGKTKTPAASSPPATLRAEYGGTGKMGTSAQGLSYSPVANSQDLWSAP